MIGTHRAKAEKLLLITVRRICEVPRRKFTSVLGIQQIHRCAKFAQRRATSADVIRRTDVAKGAERILPHRSRGFVKFQIRTCSRFENFTNPLVVRSPRSGGTRSGCNPRERCGERSGADFATTFRRLARLRAQELINFC